MNETPSNGKVIQIKPSKPDDFDLKKFFENIISVIEKRPEIKESCRVLVSFLIDTEDNIGVYCTLGNITYIEALAANNLTNHIILSNLRLDDPTN
mgnify:CR=1 FL=1